MISRVPYVIVRRAREEQWTASDAQWMREMQRAPVWEKAVRYSHDSILVDVVGDVQRRSPDYVRGFVAGRLAQLEYLEWMAGKDPVAARAKDPESEELPDGGTTVGDERVPMQVDSEYHRGGVSTRRDQ